MQLFDIINKPLGWVLEFFAGLFGGNFAGAVFLFTLFINVLLIPLSIKSQQSSVQQTRIKPKLDELKKRYGDDRQQYSAAMQKLYEQEGVKMSGGCLPMILRLALMLCIYNLILSPLTYMSGVDKTQINNVTTVITENLNELKNEDKDKYNEYKNRLNWREGAQNELGIVSIIRGEDDILKDLLSKEEYAKIDDDLEKIAAKDKESNIKYYFITEKLDLTKTPKFSLDIFHDAQLIWIMPFMSFAAQMLSSTLSSRMQKKLNPEAPSMGGMMLMMSLFSLFIGFSFPSGVTFYWACSSLIGGIIQLGVQHFYGPYKMLSRERSKELSKQCDFEAGQIKKIIASKGEEN